MTDECVREEQKVLNISIGTERESWELSSKGSVVNAILRQIHKEFGHHKKDPYEFGHGTVAFPTWIRGTDYEWIKQKRYVGNRHDINFENAMLNFPMVAAYTGWLREFVMTSNDNKLQHRLLLKIKSFTYFS